MNNADKCRKQKLNNVELSVADSTTSDNVDINNKVIENQQPSSIPSSQPACEYKIVIEEDSGEILFLPITQVNIVNCSNLSKCDDVDMEIEVDKQSFGACAANYSCPQASSKKRLGSFSTSSSSTLSTCPSSSSSSSASTAATPSSPTNTSPQPHKKYCFFNRFKKSTK